MLFIAGGGVFFIGWCWGLACARPLGEWVAFRRLKRQLAAREVAGELADATTGWQRTRQRIGIVRDDDKP